MTIAFLPLAEEIAIHKGPPVMTMEERYTQALARLENNCSAHCSLQSRNGEVHQVGG